MIGPLDGVRVLELSNWAAAPSACAIMADLGADVWKVEALGGDAARGALRQASVPEGEHNPDHPFNFINRGKRSIAVDLSHENGAELVRRMAATVDVVITNLLEGRRARFGLNPEDLFAVKSTLVIGLFSGYGEEGDEIDRRGYDLTAYFARGGPQGSTLGPDGAPPKFPAASGDHTAGLALFAAVMTGLRARDVTGEGQVVEASLLRTATWTMALDLATAAVDGKPVRLRRRTETVSPMIAPYRCSDDRWIQLTMPIAKDWGRFCNAIGRPDLRDDPRYATPSDRYKSNSVLVGLIDEIFATRTRQEWGPILDEHGVTWAPINTTTEVYADPQVRATGAFEPIDHPKAGRFDTVASPFRLHTADARVRGPAPDLGEHTIEILSELGLDDAAIEGLIVDNIVVAGQPEP